MRLALMETLSEDRTSCKTAPYPSGWNLPLIRQKPLLHNREFVWFRWANLSSAFNTRTSSTLFLHCFRLLFACLLSSDKMDFLGMEGAYHVTSVSTLPWLRLSWSPETCGRVWTDLADPWSFSQAVELRPAPCCCTWSADVSPWRRSSSCVSRPTPSPKFGRICFTCCMRWTSWPTFSWGSIMRRIVRGVEWNASW